MVTEVRIYAEGGGEGKDTKARLREGLSIFLQDLVDTARERRIRWQIIACGSRNNAFDAFSTALQTHSTAFNILLVDSEGPLNSTPWQHLRNRDGWNIPAVGNDQCHLMVQMMEAWLVADIDALSKFYGHGFRAQTIPRVSNVEHISKDALQLALKQATQDTQPGEYHKTKHAPKVLALVNANKVRQVAPYCERLFTTLTNMLG